MALCGFGIYSHGLVVLRALRALRATKWPRDKCGARFLTPGPQRPYRSDLGEGLRVIASEPAAVAVDRVAYLLRIMKYAAEPPIRIHDPPDARLVRTAIG